MEIKFSWNQSLSVYDEALDAQHKQLLEQINALLDAVTEGKENKAIVEESLKFLDVYIVNHFKEEEHYMAIHHFPERERHRVLHEQFSSDYLKLKEKLLSYHYSPDMIITELESRLAHWWIDHIGQEDKKYAEYVRSMKL